MKKLFAIALLASAFTFTSCGGGSLVDKVATCTCETVNTAVKFKKEIDAAPEDKKAEVTAKAEAAMKAVTCMTALEGDIKKMSADTSAANKAKLDAMETEVKAAIEKKCGPAMKEMGGM